ncbi:hypothetical protein EGM70_04320 [Enterobacteriaceae bacterium 89]|nr:hypothetical protein [Enterobacteriaceae bacterium 89]
MRSKPMTVLESLLPALANKGIATVFQSGQIYTFSEGAEAEVLLIKQGLVALHRSSDERLIYYIQAPALIGINRLLESRPHYYLHIQRKTRASVIPVKALEESVEEKGLWKALFEWQCYLTSKMHELLLINSHRGSEEVVRYFLTELANEPKSIRWHCTVAEYVIARSGLSRSNVMKCLAQLRASQQIVMKNGFLEFSQLSGSNPQDPL